MDKRVIKTKDRIIDAFLSLIKVKPSNKITVSEITKIADIERKTFYLHYNSIEDVYSDIENKISIELENEANKYIDNPNYQIKNLYYNLNTVINNNFSFFKSIATNDSYYFFLHSFENILSKIIIKIINKILHVDTKNVKYYANFFTAGIIKLYTSWLKGETDLTLDELTIILTRATFLTIDELVDGKK